MKKYTKPIFVFLIICVMLFTVCCSKNAGENQEVNKSSSATISGGSNRHNSAQSESGVSSVESSKNSSANSSGKSFSTCSQSNNLSSEINQSASKSQSTSVSFSEAEQITFYERESAPAKYKYVNYSFDSLNLEGSAIAQQAPNVVAVSKVDITAGDSFSLVGWIGFKQAIKQFGYFFNNDISMAEVSNEFMQVTESAVINAGGAYAKRFNIEIDTSKLSNGENDVCFIAVLNDGTYVIMYNIQLNASGKQEWNGLIIEDSFVEKAEKESLSDSISIFTTKNSITSFTTSGGLDFQTEQGGLYNLSTKYFSLTKGVPFVVNFSQDKFENAFNKYKIVYYSTAPLKAILTYECNSQAQKDIVYLESGRKVFNALTLEYFNSILSRKLTSISFEVLNSQTASFSLYDISTTTIENVGTGLKFIENERYQVGVKLYWGGGISYIQDKNDNNSKLDNLINNYDPGRLVQQSYYGTTDSSEYQTGTYNGSSWAYNPVQGGNVHGSPSRIIDFVIEDRSIYVKAQPRDWAKTDLTPSYMENVYTIYSNKIVVDNNFIDFSGYKKATERHQELPALYTVGYLNTFVYYGGASPWTNGALSYNNALSFWGGNSNAYFNINSSNTETWCAFINQADNYGLGLFTPNAEILLAGRYLYDEYPDAVSASSPACSYVSPLKTFKLESFKQMSYSYMISTGSVEEIRNVFSENNNFADNSNL